MNELVKFEDLLGKTIESICLSTEEIIFEIKDYGKYVLTHSQECCENVYIEDICGDLIDLIGSPITLAEEVISDNKTPENIKTPEDYSSIDSYTWTFYKLSTIKESVTIRFFGTSNGYYSERVDFLLQRPYDTILL